MKARAARTRSRATKTLLLTAAAALSVAALFERAARAASDDEGPVHGLAPFVLLSVALMLLVAKLGGELFVKMGQPAVLGELVGGILLGSLSLFGVGWVDQLRTDVVIGALAEIGVIILL